MTFMASPQARRVGKIAWLCGSDLAPGDNAILPTLSHLAVLPRGQRQRCRCPPYILYSPPSSWPPPEPAQRRSRQRIAHAFMRHRFDRLADERLNQKRLGVLFRNAARHQVELEILIERAGCGPVAALHIVCKNL